MRWLLAALLAIVITPLTAPPEVVVAPQSDAECLAWAIHDEARGEPLKGQRAVVDVIEQRMRVRRKTACEVVKEPKQFSGYKGEDRLKLTQEMLTKYEEVSKMQPVAKYCEYFHATYVSPAWRWKMKRCKQVGKHIFYQARKESTLKEK